MEFINMDKRFKISKTLIIHSIFLCLFIVATIRPNDAYGFDSANSCSTQESKQARRGRAQMLATIPCDLTRQVYCHLPGSAYPWHAVRRFVHENHGLMKRMYGDVRHISVLRDEIFNNEIDVDDYEDVAERYSKQPHRVRAPKNMHQQYNEYESIKNNDELTEPHFREVSTTKSTTPTTTTTPSMEAVSEESTSESANERKEPKMKNEHPNLKRVAGGTQRRRVNATTNGNGHRRRINVYLNRNRPLHSSLRRRTSTITTTTTTEEPKLFIENTEQTSEKAIGDENIFEIAVEDGNIASNSVYEISTSPEVALLPGDNIQIIESPQLGQLQKPLTEQKNNSESATISTTLKVVSMLPLKVRPALGSADLQEGLITEVEHQRHPQIIKLHQVKKTTNINADISGSKESLIPKLEHSNKSEDLQINTNDAASMSTTTVTHAVKGIVNDDKVPNSNGDREAMPTNSEDWVPSTAAIASGQNEHINIKLQAHDDEKEDSLELSTGSEKTFTPTVAPSTPIELVSTSNTTFPLKAEAATSEEGLEADRDESEEQKQPQELPQSTSTQTTPISSTSTASTKPVLREGQLYQDAVKQEVNPPPNVRGINACPGKEEVVAPFWANNTRGEVLALLNLYPFEQYVHWEKCTQENRQMYCREGCRCEQQYRLHRLLAYDPHNECRGIFSDWFRFPSCCVCKCYGIPIEFRATSRSPRSERMEEVKRDKQTDEDLIHINDSAVSEDEYQRQHPLDVAEKLVRQAIYEHATEDWYRPRDDFDFYDEL